MLQKFLNWQWSRYARSPIGNLEAARFTLVQGKSYRATITLTGFETWAGNDLIAANLKEAGFQNIKISGEGSKRCGEGRWARATTSAPVDAHLSEIVEIA